MILSKNSKSSVSSSNFLNSSSVKCCNCFSNFFEIVVSNFVKAVLQAESRKGRRCFQIEIQLILGCDRAD